jgi:hypothetical protein
VDECKPLTAGAEERQELLDQIAKLTAGSGRVLRFFLRSSPGYLKWRSPIPEK